MIIRSLLYNFYVNQDLDSDDDCGCDDTNMSDAVNKHPQECTVCTGDTSDNIWFVPRAPGYPGRCILDEINYDDVYTVLLRVPCAAKDLARITNNPVLLALSREVKLIKDPIEDSEAAAKRINANTLPFYTVFKGNMGGDIGHGK
jgi:hypothetical protein